MTSHALDRTQTRGIPQPIFLEPRTRAQDASNLDRHWTLPEELITQQLIRLQLFYAVGVILWSINFAMDIYLAPQGDRGPYRLLIEGLAAAMAAAIAAYIRFGRSNHRTKIRLGVAAIVPHAFGLALLNSWTQQSTTMRPISSVTVLILFFGTLAPARPTQMLAAGLIAASMDRRVDIYAVGCVAYFLLTGERVFGAANPMKVLMQHVQEEPMPPSHRTELRIPRGVDEFVLACLRKDPKRRPASAEELLQMASTCKTADLWDQRAARKWWEAHLSHFATPANANTSTWDVGARCGPTGKVSPWTRGLTTVRDDAMMPKSNL